MDPPILGAQGPAPRSSLPRMLHRSPRLQVHGFINSDNSPPYRRPLFGPSQNFLHSPILLFTRYQKLQSTWIGHDSAKPKSHSLLIYRGGSARRGTSPVSSAQLPDFGISVRWYLCGGNSELTSLSARGCRRRHVSLPKNHPDLNPPSSPARHVGPLT